MPENLVIFGFVAAGLVGLNGKIVYDWLKQRKTGQEKQYCPLHTPHHEDIEGLKRCTMVLKGDVSRHEVLLTERTTEIFKKLDESAGDIKELGASVSKIARDLAVFVSHGTK